MGRNDFWRTETTENTGGDVERSIIGCGLLFYNHCHHSRSTLKKQLRSGLHFFSDKTETCFDAWVVIEYIFLPGENIQRPGLESIRRFFPQDNPLSFLRTI